jgi:hypothetical protein
MAFHGLPAALALSVGERIREPLAKAAAGEELALQQLLQEQELARQLLESKEDTIGLIDASTGTAVDVAAAHTKQSGTESMGVIKVSQSVPAPHVPSHSIPSVGQSLAQLSLRLLPVERRVRELGGRAAIALAGSLESCFKLLCR